MIEASQEGKVVVGPPSATQQEAEDAGARDEYALGGELLIPGVARSG
jgi:hypothetical protein